MSPEMKEVKLGCEDCGAPPARRYVEARLEPGVGTLEELSYQLCVGCARARRRASPSENGAGVTRDELIAEYEEFFARSGALEICRRCHAQGTGCCPSSCRSLRESGCADKTLWCSAFICAALLNALRECDREAARRLQRAAREIGPLEIRVYEMKTRVPEAHREGERLLRLPRRYPPLGLDGAALRARLLGLAGEVLAVRRAWAPIEHAERAAAAEPSRRRK
jgi:hypothetical protein